MHACMADILCLAIYVHHAALYVCMYRRHAHFGGGGDVQLADEPGRHWHHPHQPARTYVPLSCWCLPGACLSIHPSIRQPTNQPSNQSTVHPTTHTPTPFCQSIHPSIKQSIHRPLHDAHPHPLSHEPTTLSHHSSQIANDVRHLLKGYSKTIPTVLEIPSKDHPYDPEHDFIMQRVNMMTCVRACGQAVSVCLAVGGGGQWLWMDVLESRVRAANAHAPISTYIPTYNTTAAGSRRWRGAKRRGVGVGVGAFIFTGCLYGGGGHRAVGTGGGGEETLGARNAWNAWMRQAGRKNKTCVEASARKKKD